MGQNESKAPTKFKINQNNSTTRNTVVAPRPSSSENQNSLIPSFKQETPSHNKNPNQLATSELVGKKQGQNYQEESVLFTSAHLKKDLNNKKPGNSPLTQEQQYDERPMSFSTIHSLEQKYNNETISCGENKNQEEKCDAKTTLFSMIKPDMISDEQLIDPSTQQLKDGRDETGLFSISNVPEPRDVIITDSRQGRNTEPTSHTWSQRKNELSNLSESQSLKSSSLSGSSSINNFQKQMKNDHLDLFSSPELKGHKDGKKSTSTLQSQSLDEENCSISRPSKIELNKKTNMISPFTCQVETIEQNPKNLTSLLSGQPLIQHSSISPKKSKESVVLSTCNDNYNLNIGGDSTNVLDKNPVKKLIDSGNPFLQTITKGKLAKNMVAINVNDQSLVVPPSLSENCDDKASDVNMKDINIFKSPNYNHGSGLDDSVNENLETISSDTHIKNQKSPLKGQIINSKNDKTINKTLQHVQKIAENLACSTVKNHHKEEIVKTEFTDFLNKGRHNQWLLHNCIVKMRNVSDYDNKEFVLSLQKEIIGHLREFEHFTSALKTCPIINFNIISLCEIIEGNLKGLQTNCEKKNAHNFIEVTAAPKVDLEINKESSNASNVPDDIRISKKTLDKDSNNEGGENKAISISLNPFMTLLDQLPEYLAEEKQYISLKDTQLYCRICGMLFPFALLRLKEHLCGKTHRSVVASTNSVSSTDSANNSLEMNSLPNKQTTPESVENLSDPCEVEPIVKNNLPNYKGVLDLITKSIKEGYNFNVNVYICLLCDFFENDKNKALNHAEKNHKDEETAWYHCGTCLIHMYGTSTHFMDHCSSEQHLTIVKIKSEFNQDEVVQDKFIMMDELDRASVCSSKSESSTRSNSRMTPHEILLSIAKDKIDKNISGPFGLYCQVCNKYALESGHLDSSSHAKYLAKQKFKRKSLSFKQCSTCDICLFGDDNVWKEHTNLQIHKELQDVLNVRNKETLTKGYGYLSKGNILDDNSKVHCSSSRSDTQEEKETNVSGQNLVFDECGPHYDFMKIVLKKHFLDKKPASDLYGLYCHLCQLFFHDQEEWESHLGCSLHKTRINSPECVGRKFVHICASCNIMLIGDEHFYENHLQSLTHKAISAIPEKRQQLEESESESLYSEDENDYNSSEDEQDGEEYPVNNAQSNSEKANGLQGKSDVICIPNGVYFKGLLQNFKIKDIAQYFKQFGPLESFRVFKGNSSGSCIYRNKIDATTVLMKKTIEINKTKVIVRPLTTVRQLSDKDQERFRPKLDPDVISVLSSKRNLDATVSDILREMNLNFHLNQKKGIEISQDLSCMMPGCRVLFFGSQVTGLATADSDFDIYIDYDGKSFYSDLQFEKQQEIIRHLKHQLMQRGSRFVIKETILEARVPIIRVVHMKTNTLCDISCRSGLSVENSHLVKVYLELDPRIRWLVVAIKLWMYYNGLLDRTAFTSYATVWLVLFFLMRSSNPVVCPVITLQRNCKPYTVARWDCRFHRDMREISRYFKSYNQMSEVQLLSAFFQMYSTFPFGNSVICPLNGHIFSRKQFQNVQNLPREFTPYVEKVLNSKTAEKLKIQTPICLQDPFDLSHNITKGVNRNDLDKFKKLCLESHRMCQNMLR